ncbi:MAG: TetR/AcrR family transcriptional regulator [Phenylobacterium sp.]|nr:TetR/AcrR family transcriptional regulator [Phenylobacterium sp.]MBC7166551.1 TetR/AcrR family transcriptional regulator [Phenylobacterium sp.]
MARCGAGAKPIRRGIAKASRLCSPRRVTRAAADPAPAKREPRQERGRETYERLLQVAGELLAEVGVERISTNQICARAGMTPPALYRYFKDKYAVLEALGRRLMERQNAVLFDWVETHAPGGPDALAAATEDLLRRTAEATAAEPGAIWILRALRAVPQLAPIRIESHRAVTDRLVEAYGPLAPDLPREVLWRRVRIAVEFGFAADEMLTEEDLIPREALIAEAAAILRHAIRP